MNTLPPRCAVPQPPETDPWLLESIQDKQLLTQQDPKCKELRLPVWLQLPVELLLAPSAAGRGLQLRAGPGLALLEEEPRALLRLEVAAQVRGGGTMMLLWHHHTASPTHPPRCAHLHSTSLAAAGV